MITSPSKSMLEDRISRLFAALRVSGKSFDTAIIISRVNQYYYTGTMQDGVLILRRDGTTAYFVRKSFDRAMLESPLSVLYRIATYKDILAYLPQDLGSTFFETETVPVATLERLKKYFVFGELHPLDRILTSVRSIKTDYELEIIAESGKQHCHILQEVVPQLLREGMSEMDFAADLYCSMLKLGHHGVSRFSMFQMEMIIGQIGFGESSIYPTNFDGPGGMRGLSPAVPILGSRDRSLTKGDIVFADVGYGIMGYHSDKTQVYSFGKQPEPHVTATHNACRNVLDKAAGLLQIGSLPTDIYQESMRDLPPELSQHFMGYGQDAVKFLGHGVGLYIDEMPVIAAGSKTPLAENMVIALEPKCGIEGIGMVGVEETFVVKRSGAVCVTGGAQDIMVL
jgi:Xaa-Pro dipeptidase